MTSGAVRPRRRSGCRSTPSVSGTLGSKQLGTLHAAYGDVFGEVFTADLCRDIAVTPVPAPTLTKTPATQGPVATGSPVTWTLRYGNTGRRGTAGRSAAGHAAGRASPTSPAPRCPCSPLRRSSPRPTGTIVRWNVGTIAPGTPNAGMVTITAKAGAVTSRRRHAAAADVHEQRGARGDGCGRHAVRGRGERLRRRPGARHHARQVGRQDGHRLAAGHGHLHAHAALGERRPAREHARDRPVSGGAEPAASGRPGGHVRRVRPDPRPARARRRGRPILDTAMTVGSDVVTQGGGP